MSSTFMEYHLWRLGLGSGTWASVFKRHQLDTQVNISAIEAHLAARLVLCFCVPLRFGPPLRCGTVKASRTE